MLKSLPKSKFQIVSIPSLSLSQWDERNQGTCRPQHWNRSPSPKWKAQRMVVLNKTRMILTHIITTIFRSFAVCTLKVVSLLFYCFIVFHLVIVLVPPNRQFQWLLVPKSVVSPCAAHGEVIVAHRRRPRPPGAPGHFGQRLEPAPCTLASSQLQTFQNQHFPYAFQSYTCHMSKIVSRFPAVSVPGWVPRLLEPYNPQRGSRKHPPSCTELEQQLGAPLGAGFFFGFSTNQTYLYSKTLYSGSLLTLVLLLYTNANYIWYIYILYTNYNMISINFITLVYFMSYKFYCRVLDSWTSRKV